MRMKRRRFPSLCYWRLFLFLALFGGSGRWVSLAQEHHQNDSNPLTTSTTIVNSSSNDQEVLIDFVTPQVDWLRSLGGFVNTDKIEFRRAHPENPNSRYGVFAINDITESEVLLRIPRSSILDGGKAVANPTWVCQTIRNLIHEIQLGNQSKYAPYVNYLHHYVERTQQHGGQNPSVWTPASKELLLQVLGQHPSGEKNVYILPPADPVGWIDNEWKQLCNGGDDEFEHHIVALVLTRGWDDLLIPLFDYFGHRNGRWHNTESNSVYDEHQDVIVKATRPIRAGEEIHTSYDSCADCGGRGLTYGTAELLRDYGFVESFPQKWIFHEQQVGFTLAQIYEVDGSVVPGSELVLTWLDGLALQNDTQKNWFREQLDRLQALGETTFVTRENNQSVPQQEWDVIVKYKDSVVVAIKQLLQETPKEKYESSLDATHKVVPRARRQGPHARLQGTLGDYIQPQIDWVRSKGGYVSESIEIRRVHPENPNSRFAVFAKQDIPPSELLVSIPRSCMISAEKKDPNWICDTTFNLIREFELGDQSDWAPYVNYLKVYIQKTQEHGGQNPGVWSDAGKRLLYKVLDKQPGVPAVLPPEEPTSWVELDWMSDCELGDDEYDQHVAALVLTRGTDDVMIPIYDFLGHRNGPWQNTETSSIANLYTEDFFVRSKRTIKAGEEIFTSYDDCPGCIGRLEYGTPELLRDYGFVESFPQRWIFPSQHVAFTLDQSTTNSSELSLTCFHKQAARAEKLPWFEQQLERLRKLDETELKTRKTEVPELEWDTIVKYTHAMMVAMEELLRVAKLKAHHDATGQDGLLELELIQKEVEWVKSSGGFVSDRIQFMRVDQSNPNSRIGAFAKTDINMSDLILSIPRDCIISSEVDEPNWICETTVNLIREISLGEESDYGPYVQYLEAYMQRQKRGGLNPSLWSQAGKNLLLQMLGKHSHAGVIEPVLPPVDPVGWIEHEWENDCYGEDDPFEHHAVMMVLSRGFDDLLIPLLDLFAHRNGRWYNAGSNSIHKKAGEHEDVRVQARRPIKAGEEIFISYYSCDDCSSRRESYGTPELLRDYGFIEEFPQKWIFHDQEVAVVLDWNYTDDGKIVDESGLVLEWLGKPAKESTLDFFEQEIIRLEEFGENLESYKSVVPPPEWDVIHKYFEAIEMALNKVVEEAVKHYGSKEDKDCNGGACIMANTRYDTLSESFDFDRSTKTCDIDKSTDLKKYKKIEFVYSGEGEQSLVITQDPDTKDTCYSHGGHRETCGSYRAHYNEMMVHYGARFLKSVKRVAWIGGHSMLLHEILKYPVDLVVGLEEDQWVPRYALKHFGVQLRFEDPRVQWYFGDIGNSLSMLPSDLYGTFDLVLVGAHEIDGQVSVGLDIMGAITKLLKPTGVFVKDDVSMELKDWFGYTVFLHFYDVPVVCSQGFILGSQSNDFLLSSVTNHQIESHIFGSVARSGNRYQHIHDYVMNPSPKQYCKDPAQTVPMQKRLRTYVEEQSVSPGILMILEAENASGKLAPSQTLYKGVVSTALKSIGFNVVSAVVGSGPRSLVAVVLREGYVVARSWPENNYVAFDIFLWSNFKKLDSVKSTLISSVGSEKWSVSSFRVVTGGMFGVSSWKDDLEDRGPKLDKECFAAPKLLPTSKYSRKVLNTALRKSFGLLSDARPFVVVVCGQKNIVCSAHETLSRHEFEHVLPLWTCPSIVGGVEFYEDAGERKYKCELDVIATLKDASEEYEKVGALVLDIGAPFEMAQILLKIAGQIKFRRSIFSSNLMVLAPVVIKSDKWRHIFVDKFRTIFLEEPVWHSKVQFNNSENDLELSTFLTGDALFIQHLSQLLYHVEKQTGVPGKVTLVEAGVFKFQDNFKPSRVLRPSDYDHAPAYQQWISQRPRGYQTVIQIESEEKTRTTVMSCNKVKSTLEDSLSEMRIEVTQAPKSISNVGDGCVVIAIWAEGSAIVSWDGRHHLDLNLFLYEDNALGAATLAEKFIAAVPTLKVVRRDDMPRGHGRVVNFLHDLEPREDPHWFTSS